MRSRTAGLAIFATATVATLLFAFPRAIRAGSPDGWSPRAAAGYLDGRLNWWLTWPNAARDHDTACVSCHTALPYALARPALRSALREADVAAPERAMLSNVLKRVQMWKDVEPFYPDQTRGLPKSSESRGTESILNALILATRDAQTRSLSDDARQAFANMWALQFKAGDLKGAWAWLNFHYEPWESTDSPYYGATLAALAIGRAPGGYAASADIKDQLTLLREYLQRRVDSETLFNRAMALWASGDIPGLITEKQQRAIVDAALARQHADGGWTTAELGSYKRVDGTEEEAATDGFATAIVTLALQAAAVPASDAHVKKARAWLAEHQDPATGMWFAPSLNKNRDRATDVGKFMSDAATAYAALALTANR